MGGSVEEVEVDDDEETVRVLSHSVTHEMLSKGMTIEEIAKVRSITEDTIVSHVEKLVDQGEQIDFTKILPNKKELQKIQKAFDMLKSDKLTPIFDELGGKVSFTMLKLVRAYRNNNKTI
jgi:ATP-dependent DNA helicase RecQ